MKNIYLFFIFLFLAGCGYNLALNTKNTSVSCPSILFGSGHKVYLGSSKEEVSLDNIEYKGKINNAIFSEKCILKDNIFFAEISILFITQPLLDEVTLINMPFYIAILNQDNKLQEMLYFSVIDQFKINIETNKSIETEVTKTITLKNKDLNENSIIVIGYILDEKRKEILN